MTFPLHGRARARSPVVALSVLLLASPSPALAQTGGVVVLTFTGQNAAASRNAVVNELRSRVELVPRDRLESERGRHLSEPDPDIAACRAIGARAIVLGETVRERTGKVLRTRVRSCRTGQTIGEQAVPWRRRTLHLAKLRAAAAVIASAAESEATPAPPPPLEAAPPPPPTGQEPEEPDAPSAPPGEGWLEVGLTAGLGIRSMDVDIDPRNPTEPAGSENTNLVYEGGAYIDAGIEGSFYPFRLAESEPRGLGLRGRFLRAISVESEALQDDADSPASPDTTVEDFLVEVFYRIDLTEGPTPPALRLSFGWNRFAFVLEENAHLPTFIYESLRPGVAVYVPISGPGLALEAGGGLRLVSGPGSGADEGLGPGEASGFDFFVGLRGDLSGGLFWTFVAEYIPYSLTFESERGEAELHRAGEGNDAYLRARGLIGYRFE